MKPIFRNVNVTILFAALCCLESCVSTEIASFKDPNYRNAEFARILVIGNFEKFVYVQKFEKFMVEALKERGIYAVMNSSLLPPMREYTDEDKRKAFVDEKLDSYMIISPAGVNNATLYVPTISSTSASVRSNQNSARGSSTTVTSEGGQRDVVSSVDMKGELYDFQNGNIIWKAEANTQIHYNAYGQTFARPDDLVWSFCVNAADKLKEDGLLKKNK